MKTINKKWLVWNPSAHIPKYEHDSFDSAQREAERLAGIHSGYYFYVLETVGVAIKKDVHFVPINSMVEEIPF
jgi:hypothetical protein